MITLSKVKESHKEIKLVRIKRKLLPIQQLES